MGVVDNSFLIVASSVIIGTLALVYLANISLSLCLFSMFNDVSWASFYVKQNELWNFGNLALMGSGGEGGRKTHF